MAMPIDTSPQQDAPSFEYIRKFETEEYIARIRKGEVDPEQERPTSFPPELIPDIRRIEMAAKNIGKLQPVKIQIDRARKESPVFEAVYQGTEKQQPKEDEATEVKSKELIIPPLPEDVALPPEASLGACKWHDRYVQFSQERSPRSFHGFHVANGWSLLSTVAKRRVVLYDLGAPKYTPLFAAIVARSSIASKTEAARVFIAVLEKAGLKWMLGPDEMTPQAMIDHMKKVEFIKVEEMETTDRAELERTLGFAGQLGWFYEEFGEYIEAICANNGVMAPFKGIIRRMDDCHDEYKRKTISHQEQVVQDPYLSLLACMTPLDLKPYAGIDSPFWTNGFFARFAFTVPDDSDEENNARFPTGNLNEAVPPELITPLAKWHQSLGQRHVVFNEVTEKGKKGVETLKGYEVGYGPHPQKECKATEEAMDAFYRYGDALKAIIKKERLDHFEGNYIRFPMMAMRIAMLCASLENDGRIEMKHWAKGQEFSEQARQGLHHLWIELNKNSFAQEQNNLEDEICKYIAEQETYVSVRMLTRGKFRNHTAEKLTPIIDNLVSSGDLVKHPPVRGGGKYYTVSGKESRKLPDTAKKS
jgi:hypothetical protein